MNLDRWILIAIICFSIIMIWIMVPKKKAREAWVLFLSMGMITWPAGLLAVEMGWIKYPVQLLARANDYNKASFTYEFFLFPMTSVVFSLYYSKVVSKISQFLYFFLFAGMFTIVEVILEKTTMLVEYDEWKWYWTLFTLMVSLYLNHKYYEWFKKRLKVVSL